MKNIYKKVKVSPFFLFLILIAFLSGLFKDTICLFIIIIIHELGHIFFSLKFGWNIKKVDLTICGGFITYEDVIDKPFKEEFIIATAGFLFQFLLYVILILLRKINVIDDDTLFILNKYNISILLFNLIPIYPLDGSKIMYNILNVYLPYKKTLRIINATSIMCTLGIILYALFFNIKIEYSYIIILTFIIGKIINHIKDVPYLFNKLLFERYVYPINVKKYNYVNSYNLAQFKRQKKNYFKINNHYVKESIILSKKFD